MVGDEVSARIWHLDMDTRDDVTIPSHVFMCVLPCYEGQDRLVVDLTLMHRHVGEPWSQIVFSSCKPRSRFGMLSCSRSFRTRRVQFPDCSGDLVGCPTVQTVAPLFLQKGFGLYTVAGGRSQTRQTARAKSFALSVWRVKPPNGLFVSEPTMVPSHGKFLSEPLFFLFAPPKQHI